MRRVLQSIACAIVLIGACRTYDITYTDDAGNDCDSGLTSLAVCDGVCIDVSTDRSNCGSCGNTCAVNQQCAGGVCTTCPSGTIACGQAGATFCTNVSSDSTNCGQCGNACAHGSTCVSGACVCPLTTCGSDCVDTNNDVQHCGGCNTPCTSSGANETPICSQAQCTTQCIAPFADCDGVGSNGCESNLQTSDTSCGVCNRACSNGGTCSSGSCPITTYATGNALGGLAIDSTYVYYVDQSTSGGIQKTPIAGGSPTLVYADPQATALAIDSNRIVWIHVNTLIQSQLLSGGTVSTLATLSSLQALTASSGYVYFTTSTAAGRAITDGSSASVTIANASDAATLAVDATTLYFADFSGEILTAPIDQQNVTPTVFESVGATEIAADANSIYWITTSGLVQKHTKTGGALPATIGSSESIATNLVTDGNALYWGAPDGTIHRLPVTGGASKVLATQQGTLRAVALDATNVYWTSTTAVAATAK